MRIRRTSGDFPSDRNMAGLIFFPRLAGKQNITVKAIVGGRNVLAKDTFDWKQTPFMAVMGHAGDREILGKKERQLTVAVANVADTRISFNGKEIQGKLSGSDIRVCSLDPAWRPGKNVLTVSANKFDGSLIVRNFTFFYPGEGTSLPLGETAVFYYGKEGSKSGPFYDVAVEGDVVAIVRDVKADFLSMDSDGWFSFFPMLGKELRAHKPGSAVIRVFAKPYFLEKKQRDREIIIKVEQR